MATQILDPKIVAILQRMYRDLEHEAKSITVDNRTKLSTSVKIKRGLPINVDMSTLPTFTPFAYQLIPISTDSSGTTYTIQITNIPIIGMGNHIRVYLFENSLGLKDIRFMRFAEKVMKSDRIGRRR